MLEADNRAYETNISDVGKKLIGSSEEWFANRNLRVSIQHDFLMLYPNIFLDINF